MSHVLHLCLPQNCRICRGCGVRSSGQWANHPFLCKSCDPALPCPGCDSSPDPYNPQETVTCVCCYRYPHSIPPQLSHQASVCEGSLRLWMCWLHLLFLSISSHSTNMDEAEQMSSFCCRQTAPEPDLGVSIPGNACLMVPPARPAPEL